jgi:hypothetical protein
MTEFAFKKLESDMSASDVDLFSEWITFGFKAIIFSASKKNAQEFVKRIFSMKISKKHEDPRHYRYL